ncbi:MAG: glycosyltransferase family 4 protein [Verrucomicrobiales bacterium]|nr:glycosyltransferase family 4 protein [Verrucomicrobiales bacterium]
MRVAVDTNPLYTTRAGVARYVRGLLDGLRAEGNAADWDLHPFAWEVENFGFRQPMRAWRTFYREFLWAGWVAPRRLRSHGVQLLHSTGAPLLDTPRGVRHVVTVHDIGFFKFPERFRPWHRRMAVRSLERARRADRVICISQFTADELVHRAGFSRDQLRVVHNGCTLGPDSPETPLVHPALPEDFFLFVGSLEPGKNLSLMRAMYDLAARNGVNLPHLAIVGARFEGLAKEGPPPVTWHYLGHRTDAELVWLYRRAKALLFPSIYEGFGLPVAEAMNLGCPVICSPVSSLPEVAGDAALLPSHQPADYLQAAHRILQEPGLRQELIRRGRLQGARFTWRTCARATLEVYQDVGNR